MGFQVDKQTADDLNLLGRYKNNSIFSLFDQTITRGGGNLMENIFLHPLSDPLQINQRSAIFRFFQEKKLQFPVNAELFEQVESYLRNSCPENFFFAFSLSTKQKFLHYIGSDKEYEMITNGVSATLEMLQQTREFLHIDEVKTSAWSGEYEEIREITDLPQLLKIARRPQGWVQMARYDFILRSACRKPLLRLLELLYAIDVYTTVAHIAEERKFIYAEALTDAQHITTIEALYHPFLKAPVANSITIDEQQNVFFLTGANMAGKSTFMKSFGIAVFLAHLGFPVAARKMKFSVKDGIFTSINLPDNLNMGYSHFYAEVLRVKKVAEEVATGKNLYVIFDELFKGTNVKDAYDATVAVTKGFARHHKCSFIISTHIVEAGEQLKQECRNLQFYYLPTLMEGNRPRYTHLLSSGISNDRHGMMIIRNEKILDIIENAAKENQK